MEVPTLVSETEEIFDIRVEKLGKTKKSGRVQRIDSTIEKNTRKNPNAVIFTKNAQK